MTSIQEYCAATGRSLTATPPMAVAAQPIGWVDVEPWQRIESPDPAGVVVIAPTLHRGEFAPNGVGTCARIAPGMDTAQAVAAIAATAEALADWRCADDVEGEGDEDAGAVTSLYRYLRGSFRAEPGEMTTASLIVGWTDAEATYVFQYVATCFADQAEHLDAALDCLRVGPWSASRIIEAMRG